MTHVDPAQIVDNKSRAINQYTLLVNELPRSLQPHIRQVKCKWCAGIPIIKIHRNGREDGSKNDFPTALALYKVFGEGEFRWVYLQFLVLAGIYRYEIPWAPGHVPACPPASLLPRLRSHYRGSSIFTQKNLFLSSLAHHLLSVMSPLAVPPCSQHTETQTELAKRSEHNKMNVPLTQHKVTTTAGTKPILPPLPSMFHFTFTFPLSSLLLHHLRIIDQNFSLPFPANSMHRTHTYHRLSLIIRERLTTPVHYTQPWPFEVLWLFHPSVSLPA